MRKMIALACMALSALAMHGNLSAQQVLPSTGNYYRDLGVVLNIVEAVRSIADICSEEFPETRENNEKHLQIWRVKHMDLLQEIENHRIKILANPVLGPEYRRELLDGKVTFKENQRRALAVNGMAGFRASCDQYGEITRLQRWDLDKSFAEQLATMRRGPPQ
ncbi:MAG: hypothetical protein ABI893_05175 [Polaromonas sp.]|uniref:hypothetical protein n=1 Tax=Polaromonas sp. TaxID=1869339 RepID=UPI00326570FE